ncbi:MAG: glycosyltransferase [Candidatus Aureabacteria bacterium]|nr:glycosyltransferase [Candidatus Auribacterota bacterium]
MKNILISIITPSYNQAKFIRRTLDSVLLHQNHVNIEHIVVDGYSSDGTLEILKEYKNRYPDKFSYIYEKDSGQSNAINKGFKRATGDIIGWINSDDYYEKHIFIDVVKEFNDPSVAWIIGNVISTYEGINKMEKIVSRKITYQNLLKNPDIVAQQGVFFRRGILEAVGGWDDSFYMVMDYDLWIRLSKVADPKMINKYWGYFTHHSNSKTLGKTKRIQMEEIMHILKRENVKYLQRQMALSKKRFYYYKQKLKHLLIKLRIIDKKYYSYPCSSKRWEIWKNK